MERPPLDPDARISVIVPTWNEEDAIGPCLESILLGEGPLEVRIADGGSTDGTLARAEALAERSAIPVRVVACPRRGRAAQMNRAARDADGSVLWFVHADSRVPPGATRGIRTALADRRTVAGSFRFAVDSPRPVFRLLERMVALRTRWLRAPYGDQGLFVRADEFRRLGGFADQPILEDLDFVRRVRRLGRLAALPDPLLTSARRWEQSGVLATTWLHARILLGDRLGTPPERLAALRRSPAREEPPPRRE